LTYDRVHVFLHSIYDVFYNKEFSKIENIAHITAVLKKPTLGDPPPILILSPAILQASLKLLPGQSAAVVTIQHGHQEAQLAPSQGGLPCPSLQHGPNSSADLQHGAGFRPVAEDRSPFYIIR
jgi:hypothetical protein